MKRLIQIFIGLIAGLLLLFVFLRTQDIPLNELKQKYTDDASQFVEIDGIEVHYKQEGTGLDLLLIHGTASSLHTWDGWVKELKNDFRITRLDLPAFGLTGPHPSGDYSISFYTNFLDEFVKTVGLDTFSIAGNSLGGGIAWSYALNNQNKIQKLILIDASGYPKEGMPSVFKIAQNPLGASLLKQVTPRSFVAKNVREVYFYDSLITESLIDRYYELTLRPGNRQAFIDRARTKLGYNYELIETLDIPTLIQWGRHDEWIPLADGEKFLSEIPNSTLKVYDAGHVPMEELPQKTADDCRTFIRNE
ncbi:alpha/beta fold hydrolase [Fulvivirga lutea]|uniref:Alpha/beta hydrolase n=1 Tax=Fulvivirga lutea TaxID=2810512 RepID=A0A974WFP7_9BACT|nr:alpha/beta hydrolase [Fulvivirga lutea]QSE97618.1 alpha/beta hydrolase [Fulvivirga lutea]